MNEIYQLLKQKELDVSRLEIEVEALRIVAPLLSDDGDTGADNMPISTHWTAPTRPVQVPKAANTDPHPEHAAEWREKVRGWP